MVSRGDIRVVREELERLGFGCAAIELGSVDFPCDVCGNACGHETDEVHCMIEAALDRDGYEAIHTRRRIVIEAVKTTIIECIYYHDERQKPDFPSLIEKKFERSYSYLSRMFSKEVGVTIEHFAALRADRLDKVRCAVHIGTSGIQIETRREASRSCALRSKDLFALAFKAHKRRDRTIAVLILTQCRNPQTEHPQQIRIEDRTEFGDIPGRIVG